MRYQPAILLAVAAASIAIPFATVAPQQPPDVAVLARALHAIPAGESIRITTVGNSNYEGRIVRLTDSIVAVSDAGYVETAELSRVRTVSVRGDAAKRGAVGTALGAAMLGGLAIGMLANGLCEYQCNGAFAHGFVVGAVVSAPAGALAGYVVGSFVDTWKRYWTREQGIVQAFPAATAPRESGWTPSVYAGISNKFDKGPWLMGVSLERQRGMGRAVGFEAGMVKPRPESEQFVHFIPNQNGSSDTVSSDLRTKRSTYYLGLITRRELGPHLVASAMAGAALTHALNASRVTRPGLSSSAQYASSDKYPVFSVGLGTRFRDVHGEMRWFAPVALGNQGWSMLTATARVALPGFSR